MELSGAIGTLILGIIILTQHLYIRKLRIEINKRDTRKFREEYFDESV